jgi:hypothetical protein
MENAAQARPPGEQFTETHADPHTDVGTADDDQRAPRTAQRDARRTAAEGAVLEQAKGVLAAWYGIDPDTAFDRLVTLSQHRNVTVDDLAAEIVGSLPESSRRAQRGLVPLPEPPDWSRRAVIEQAKGVLAAWYGLDPGPAARRLVTLAEHRNLPLHELAAQILAEGAGHATPARTMGAPAPTPSPWLYRLVDGLVDAAMVLVPVHTETAGGADDVPPVAHDLIIEHVNDLVEDPYGRPAHSLVGRRLASAFPGMVPLGLHDAYLDAVNLERAYRVDRQVWVEKAGTTVRTGVVRLHAVPICGRLVVTWRRQSPADDDTTD